MTKRCLILLFLVTSFSLRSYPQNINNDERVRDLIIKFGQAEVIIPYTDKKAIDNLTANVSILSVRNKLIYISLSPLTVDWFLLQKFDYSIPERADSKSAISAASVKQAMEWDKYPTYSQYDSIMQSFIRTYPDLCHLDTIGTSINGKLILALKISEKASISENKPEVFYTSTIHGDETGGFVMLLRLADYLLKNYSLNSYVKNLADNLNIWINPLSNPDGTYLTGNTITFPTRFNANGVDLNRNFPDPLAPLVIQQKENVDMIKFMKKHKFVLSANFHSGAELVNYPWDRWPRLHADNDWFHDISREYTDTVHAHSVLGYMTDQDDGITNGYAWYQVIGGRQDFVTYDLHGRELTIELDGNYFVTPAANLNLLWQYNRHSLLGYLRNSLFGIHGAVTDANTSAPVAAKIFITGHDRDNSFIYSDSVNGNFVRLLAPGLWDLTFSASGYYDTTISNINVFTGQKTELLVNMVPVISRVDTTNSGTPLLYPNPAVNEFRALLPESIAGTVNIIIFNMAGLYVKNYSTEVATGIPVLIDVRNLTGGSYTIVFKNITTGKSSRGRFIVLN